MSLITSPIATPLAHIECVGGASGNMLLGALLDAGLDRATLERELRKLELPPWSLEVTRVWRSGITATLLETRYEPESTARHLSDIRLIIEGSTLPAVVQATALRIFDRLAAAEAQTHGISIDEVHFHEVGAVDAILDIVGFAVGMHALGITEVHASALPVGQGAIRCAHGLMPNPAPATAVLQRGVPLVLTDWPGELVTPTGAAVITTLAQSYQLRGAVRFERVGYGAGSRDSQVPNVTRISLGVALPGSDASPGFWGHDQVITLECAIDDMSPQGYELAVGRLYEAGAFDVWLTPVQMKKLRPAVLLTAVGPLAAEARLTHAILTQTTTLGLRRKVAERAVVRRSEHPVETPYGSVRVKVAWRPSPTAQPEHDDCRRLALEHGVALQQVVDAARLAASPLLTPQGEAEPG